ncbi:MAG: hypothetical protein M3Q56_11395 [Bacteroidota bacterium]|nr:hypothetical protein [Bacteroidota bacterium]
MDIEIVKSLIDNGVSTIVLAFLLWFLVKPIIKSHFAWIQEVTAAVKEERQMCKELYDSIRTEIHITREQIIHEIKQLNK